MPKDKSKQKTLKGKTNNKSDVVAAPGILTDISRRTLLAGVAAGSLTAASLGFPAEAGGRGKSHGGHHHPHHRKQRFF